MARGKKKEELTLEEKLERALVPVEEQPYEVPENWCWTYLTIGFCECKDSFRKPINASERAKREGDIPYYGATGQVGWIDDYLTDEQLVLVGEDGAPFLDTVKDKAYLIDGKAWVNNHAHILKSYYGETGNKYIMNYLNSFNYKGYVNGTTRLKLTQASMNTIPVPLPPVQEQQCIVEQIEKLFSKLDEVREKVRSVIEQSKEDRAALIHKAYIGKLTKYWRKESGIDKSWEQIKIKELCKSLKYGTSKKSKEKGTMIVVRMGNLQNGEIIWDNLAYTDDHEDIEKYMLEKGDVLFNRTNSSEWVGKTSIYRGEYPAIYAGYLIKLDYYRDKVIGDFLNYMLNSPKAKEYCNLVKTDGVNQSNINAKKIGEFVIPVPSLEEQKEIVRILDVMSIKQKRILELVEEVMEEIVLMKKSILSKAFRGKLSTNNSEEESSIELLKKILVET